ncbi:MAG TPA: IS1595 family transposase [Arcobacter sp.]|nr:IS1595 family transposase [Arcobacter sp.]
MAQHFLLSAKARTLSIVKIAMMPDEEIHNIFKQIRWSANDGEPICPHCGITSAPYNIATRRNKGDRLLIYTSYTIYKDCSINK